MTGRTLLIGGGIFLAVFTAALWYFQTYAFYEELPPETTVLGQYPVERWDGIDASTSPLKKRVCLTVSAQTARRIMDDEVALSGGEPLVAPSWFECFDAEAIARDLEAQAARLYMIRTSVFDGVDEYLAVYPDGRAYIWRELQPEFKNQ